jgi:hypothetical protein
LQGCIGLSLAVYLGYKLILGGNMADLKSLEESINNSVLGKKAPFQLPESSKKSLVNAYQWIALVLGILQVWAAYAVWQAYDRVDEFARYANELSRAVGSSARVDSLGPIFWVAILSLGASGALMLLAYPGLAAKKKAGWNFLFYGVIVNLLAGVLFLFVNDAYGGLDKFITSLISTAIGLWLIFQVRDHYKA